MSEYIFGMHCGHYPEAVDLFRAAGRTGWIVFTEELGCDPTNLDGRDYRPWSSQGFGVIARLNHGYGEQGTIPLRGQYGAFAQRVRNYVSASPGCRVWVIGNEPNHSQERPNGVAISYADYADCYSQCRKAIKSLPGHESDEVVVAAVAPWNVETGDWLQYFEEVLLLAQEAGGVDGIALHTYTHGTDPNLIFSEERMQSHPRRYYHFKAYQDFLLRIPVEMRRLPIYITETDQDEPWRDRNSGWVRNAYQAIDAVNRETEWEIRCLCLYRWKGDKWYIEGKTGVQTDFMEAMENEYRWEKEEEPVSEWKIAYATSMESFYQYQGIGEVTCPVGSVPLWEHNDKSGVLNRPEYKPKVYPQQEVRTPPNSAGFFVLSSTMEAALVWRVKVSPGQRVRACIWAMGVQDGCGQGMRLGIATSDPGAGPIENTAGDPRQNRLLEKKAQWGEWWSVYSPDWEERKYKLLWGPTVEATGEYVWVLANGRGDWAGPGNHTHWDDLVVEVEGEVEPEPPEPEPPGEYPTLEEIRQVVREELDRTKLGVS